MSARAPLLTALVLFMTGLASDARSQEHRQRQELRRALATLGIREPARLAPRAYLLKAATLTPSVAREVGQSRAGLTMSLSETLRRLRTEPNVPHRSLFTPHQEVSSDVRVLRRQFLEQGYRVSPERYQSRANAIAGRIASVYNHELARPGRQRVAVIEGGAPEPAFGIDVTGTKLKTGGVIIARDMVDQLGRLGAVLAEHLPADGRGGRAPRALLSRVWQLASSPGAGVPVPTGGRARRLGDQALTGILTHESGHWVAGDGNAGVINAFAESQGVEKRADLIGANVAMRMSVSPAAVLIFDLWAAMKETRANVGSATHGSSARRYRHTYDYLARHQNAPRRIYSPDGQRPRPGAPYMTESMRRDLAAMPTPDALDAFLAARGRDARW